MSGKYDGHTPGPWRAEICETADGPRWKVVTDTPHFKAMALARVAGIPGSWAGNESCKANAALMADAWQVPALLAENQRLRAALEVVGRFIAEEIDEEPGDHTDSGQKIPYNPGRMDRLNELDTLIDDALKAGQR